MKRHKINANRFDSSPVIALVVDGVLDQYVESKALARREALVLRGQGYKVKLHHFDSWTDAYRWEERRQYA